MKIKLTGKSNCGTGKTITKEFEVTKSSQGIAIKDNKGEILISFAPFLNGGSVWLSDFSDIIMDAEHWGEKDGEFKLLSVESQAIANVSTSQIIKWKEDSEKLSRIKEAKLIIEEE